MALFNKKSASRPAAKAKTRPARGKPQAINYSLPRGALLIPVVSEKATRLQQLGQYMFSLVGRVSKVQAKKAIESTFGVRVVGVNSLALPGKVVRRGREVGQRQARRHLVVKVAEGESIDLGKTL